MVLVGLGETTHRMKSEYQTGIEMLRIDKSYGQSCLDLVKNIITVVAIFTIRDNPLLHSFDGKDIFNTNIKLNLQSNGKFNQSGNSKLQTVLFNFMV